MPTNAFAFALPPLGFAALAGALSLAIWVYLLLARGGFWRLRQAPLRSQGASSPKRIAAILPARNEAAFVRASLESLFAQTGGHALHVYLVDDGSRDGTAEAAQETARRLRCGSSLTVIAGASLPAGWTGKLWAVQQGVERAREFSPDFLLLTDADVAHARGALDSLIAIAERGYDLVSQLVRLQCHTLAERLLIPPFVFFFSFLYPPAWIADPRRKTAGAAGGCMLLCPQVLQRAGGIERIRGEIIDDCALAREVKRSGGRVWLELASESAGLRPYGSFAEIGRMISRSAYKQLRHSIILLAVALFGLTVTYLAPPALLITGRPPLMFLGAASWALMTLAYLPATRYFRLHPIWSLTLPLAAVFYLGATLHSAVKYWSGAGGEWKGRAQDPRENYAKLRQP